jgi:hypothetical protein
MRARVGDDHGLEQLGAARRQYLRRHTAHRQADEVHRLAGRLALDQRRRIVGQRLDAEGAGHDGRAAVVAVVVSDHRVGARQQPGHAVPHVQVAAERVAQHDDRAFALAQNVQGSHVRVSLGVVLPTGAAARRKR